MTISDFTIDVDAATLQDLRDRLVRTRWPQKETVEDWSQGIPLTVVQELCDYWLNGYDWLSRQRQLNAFDHFLVDVRGYLIHCVHARSPHHNATPLVLTHGWPGSFIEYLGLVAELTHPPSGLASEAFHVVVPSLPGYGFSSQPSQSGCGVTTIAQLWAELMSALGYTRFGCVGSDWGTSISASLGAQFPERIIALQLNPPLAAPDPDTFGSLSAPERAALNDLERANATESAYSAMADHATADDGLRSGRLARRPVCVDRREILGVDGQRRRPLLAHRPGPAVGQPDDLLGYLPPAHRPRVSTGRASRRSTRYSMERTQTPLTSPSGEQSSPRRSRAFRADGPSDDSPTSCSGESTSEAGTSRLWNSLDSSLPTSETCFARLLVRDPGRPARSYADPTAAGWPEPQPKWAWRKLRKYFSTIPFQPDSGADCRSGLLGLTHVGDDVERQSGRGF